MQIGKQGLYIHGKRTNATSGETFLTINPATSEVICEVQCASKADVDTAVSSSLEGFAKWSKMTGTERGRILHRAAQILRERNAELANVEVMDTGKPISEACAVDILSGADAIEYYAGLAATLQGSHIDFGSSFAYTRREPLGVCAGIGAWNYPIQIACWKSAPALACGNSMIFKPAELTPLSAILLAEIYTQAGLPDGVFNVVQGAGSVGQMLSQHPKIAKISLTGEVGTGKAVMRDASATLKKVTMELGGKSPLVIFADCNLDSAVNAALLANFYTQGEICSNGTRVFVERSIMGAFTEKLLERVGAIRVGDPMDSAVHMGSLISEEHMNRVLGYIEKGTQEGAKLLCGGTRLTEGALSRGCFVAPTVFGDCTDEMTIVKEEIFGPVMSLLSFDTEEEVVKRANDTNYGLAAGVFTSNLQKAHRVVSQFQAGTCWINTYNVTPVELPFGGYKHSGIGKENGLAALEHYTQTKSVFVEMGDIACPY